MSNNLDTVIKFWIEKNNQNVKTAFPAVIVGVENLKEGLVDVQPIVNHMNSLTSETTLYPVIYDIPLVFPSTKNSSICFPVNQGDFVDLIIQSVNIRDFIEGDRLPHDPASLNSNNLSNAVALVGFTPYLDSCFDPMNYKNDFDNQDLNIVHNKNTDKEVTFKLTSEGDLKVLNAKKVSFECEEFEVSASKKIKLTAPLISENGR